MPQRFLILPQNYLRTKIVARLTTIIRKTERVRVLIKQPPPVLPPLGGDGRFGGFCMHCGQPCPANNNVPQREHCGISCISLVKVNMVKHHECTTNKIEEAIPKKEADLG